ncbi:hypothetical protein [Vibrio mediterranei]|uniref:hypothetical protein n=1 Tax=Vibrio mediterranei TaxID=689 RepID=UPI00406865B9
MKHDMSAIIALIQAESIDLLDKNAVLDSLSQTVLPTKNREKYLTWLNDIERQIDQARTLKPVNGMVPSVFTSLHNTPINGVNFQPVGTKPGERFHLDHGVGIHKNQDGVVVWVM